MARFRPTIEDRRTRHRGLLGRVSGAARRAGRGAIAACAVLLLSAAPARGLDPNKQFAQYAAQSWRLGLPNASVSAIRQTRDGYLWVGTQDGLARFDGQSFTAIAPEAVEQLDRIEQLLETTDGTLWVLGRSGLLALRAGQTTLHWTSDDSPIRDIQGMREDAWGALWLLTDAGLARPTDKGIAPWKKVREPWVIWKGRDGRVRVLGAEGVRVADGRELATEPFPALPPGSLVLSAHEDRQGTVWVGTETGLLAEEEGRLRRYTTADGLCDDRADGILEDNAGLLWIRTPRGLSRRASKAGRSFECFAEADGLADIRVMSLYEDQEGSLWIGMDAGGLLRVSDGACTSYTTREGLVHDAALCVLEDREGAIWIGTQGGLSRFRDGVFTNFTTADGLSHMSVRALCQGRDGSLWIGTHRALDRRLRDGRIEVYDQGDGLASQSMRALLVTRDGSLWVGTEDGGLSHRRGNGRFESLTTRDGLTSDEMGFLFQDRRGRLWAGTSNAGINCLNQGRTTHLTTAEGLSSNRARCMYEDGDGTLWIGTNGGGLNRLRDGVITTYSRAQGLPDSAIWQILEDGNGRLWMSSNRGIFAVERDAFEAFDRGELTRLPARLFDVADGMRNQECKGRFQPPGVRCRDGRMWFPTRKGVVVVDPQHLRRNAMPPPVVIERVVVDQEDLSPAGDAHLPPGRRTFDFHYAGLSFVAPARLRFRYRLAGLETEWVEAGTERVARYRRLPPGHYTFEVIAANNDGVWSAMPAAFRFSLAPHFYQTTAFLALCGATLLLAGFLLHRLRLRQAHARFAAVLAERGRIARELHDTLMQDFTGVTWQLHAIAEGLDERSAPLHDQIDRLIGRAQRYLADARRSVLDLRDPRGVEPPGLDEALNERIQALTATAPLTVDFVSRGDVRSVPPEVQRQVLRIAQEAVANVVRHAHARRLEIELARSDRALTLRLHDDGCGFERDAAAAAYQTHFGLVGMQERARQIGAQLTVNSIPGEGTEIVLEATITPGAASPHP